MTFRWRGRDQISALLREQDEAAARETERQALAMEAEGGPPREVKKHLSRLEARLANVPPSDERCRACGCPFDEHDPDSWLQHLNYQIPKRAG